MQLYIFSTASGPPVNQYTNLTNVPIGQGRSLWSRLFIVSGGSSVPVWSYVSGTSIGTDIFSNLRTTIHQCITGSWKTLQHRQLRRYSGGGYPGQFTGLMGVLVDGYVIHGIK